MNIFCPSGPDSLGKKLDLCWVFNEENRRYFLYQRFIFDTTYEILPIDDVFLVLVFR